MRLDRTMSLYAFRPLREMHVVSRKSALPILMYHSISDEAEPGVPSYYKIVTSPSVFAQHMCWLNDSGFRSVSLEDGIGLIRRGGPQCEKVIAITFDDGFRDFHDSAFPILRSYGHTATVFLPTAFVQEKRCSFKGRECLTWSEVRDLRSQGIHFGSHTAHHPVLYDCSWPEIESELSSSKARLEQELGEEVASFAYPYAFPQQDRRFTTAFKGLLGKLGYRIGVTTMIGRAQPDDDLLGLKRLPMNNDDDESLFRTKLAGGYDAMGSLQSWSKSVRHSFGKLFRNSFKLRSVKESLESCQSSGE